MADHTDRRRFLQAAGTGTVLSLAGCSAFQFDGSGGGQDAGSTADGGSDDEATVTVAVQPDQDALQQRRSELQSQVQNGSMSRQEAQVELQSTRAELMTAATEAFEQRAADEATLSIDDSVAEIGAFRVTGTTSALIGTLSAPEVSALLPEPVFADARARANSQNSPQPTSTPE